MTLVEQRPAHPFEGGSSAATPRVASPPAGHGTSLRAVLVAVDAVAAAVAWGAVGLAGPGRSEPAAWCAGAVVAAAVVVAALGVAGLYRSRVSSVRTVELARLPRAGAASALAGWFVVDAAGTRPTIRVGVAVAVVTVVALLAARSVFDGYLRQSRKRGRHCRALLLVGDDAEAVELGELIERHAELGFRVAGRSTGRDAAEVLAAMAASGANGVLFTASSMAEVDRRALIRDLLAAGVHVHLSAGLRGLAPGRLRVVPLAYEPLLYVERARFARWQLLVKRVLDLVVASVLLVLTAPVIAVAAYLVKREDGGPVLFRQERVGRNGKPFTCLKLRTMRVGAEHEQALVENARTGPLFKAAHDPRVTRIGRFLRQSSIDELPQLWNVLRGEMSLVGPRPAMAKEVAAFDPELLRRLEVPPGITGVWQVEARDLPDFDAYRRLDLYYVDNWHLCLDLVVLLLTVEVVVGRVVTALRSRRGEIDLTVVTLD